jgi:3-dehydroquinate dehydratase
LIIIKLELKKEVKEMSRQIEQTIFSLFNLLESNIDFTHDEVQILHHTIEMLRSKVQDNIMTERFWSELERLLEN